MSHLSAYAIQPTGLGSRWVRGTGPRRAVTLVLVAVLAGLAAAPSALAARRGRRSAATITAAFADSCRDFAAHSSKDISHVVFHYVDGRVVKDGCIRSHDYAIDGAAGDEIEFAIVKSGTTSEQFDCVLSNGAPTARLEIKTPPTDQTLEHCYDFFSGGLGCEQSSPGQSGRVRARSRMSAATSRASSIGAAEPWAIPRCVASWSLDFGDGTSVSGGWATAPPNEVAHEYCVMLPAASTAGVVNSIPGVCVVTLTVTDSAGQSDSDVILMVFLDQTPD